METNIERDRPRRRTLTTINIGAVALLVCVGCAGSGGWARAKWHTDYDSAESAVRETGQPMVLRFVNPRPGRPDPLDRIFDSARVSSRLDGYVCCVLYRSYEPDRRYVSQYGVQRAPAVIVVHPDDTYHAKIGKMSVEEFLAFLDDAKPPGAPAIISPYIPREARYHWIADLDEVFELVRETGRPGLIVFHRGFTGDFRAIQAMMSKHEVFTRVCQMVHGQDGGWNRWATTRETPFGEIVLPAIVWLQPDGSHEVLEMPDSSQSIARFVDRCRKNADSAPETSVSEQTALSTQ